MTAPAKKTILLVEDDAIIAMTAAQIVGRFGYEVITAHNGARGVQIAAENNAVDLILMDIDLGKGIDGTEAARQILALRTLPIVFLTAHAEREMVEKVRGITRYGYVIKNSGDFVLQSSIEMAFDLFEAHRKVVESENYYISLFEEAPLGYQSLDENGIFLHANQTWLDILGYRKDDVIGKWFGSFLAPPYVDAFRERFPLFKAKGRIHSEFQMIHRDGSLRFIAFEGRIGYKNDGSFKQTHCILSDISERKKTEERQRLRELPYRSMIECSSDVIFCVNEKGEYVFTNSVFADTFGKTPEFFIGKTFWDVYDKEQADFRYAAVKKVFVTGISNTLDVEVPLADRTLHFLARINPIRDDAGNIVLAVTHSTDISERKQIEDALRESEERYRSILNASPDDITLTDLQGRIQMVSPAAAAMFGVDREEEHIGRLITDFIVPEEREHAVQRMAAMFRGEMPGPGEYRALRPNGEIFDIEVNGEFVKNARGEPIQIVLVVRDITERKRAEKALRDSEEKYRLLAEKTMDVIWLMNFKGESIYVSSSVIKFTGFTVGEYLAQSIEDRFTPESAALAKDALFSEVMRVGQDYDQLKEYNAKIELEYRCKDGSTKWGELLITPYYNEEGTVVGIHGATRDITERKRSEEKIQKLLTEKELLLHEVQHRVKNNLNSMKALLNLQADAMKSGEAVSALRDAGHRIGSLMLLYDKLYRSHTFAEISLLEYCPHLIDSVVGGFPGIHRIEIKKEIEDFSLDAQVLHALGMIINELITNIMKYAFIDRDSGVITVCASKKGKSVRLSVQDDGVGLPAAVDIGGSAGFGLQLVDMLTKQLEGTIHIERGGGTKFVLEFETHQ